MSSYIWLFFLVSPISVTRIRELLRYMRGQKKSWRIILWSLYVKMSVKKTHRELRTVIYFIPSMVLSFTAANIQCGAFFWVSHQKCIHTIWSVGLAAVYEQQVVMFSCTATAYFSSTSWKRGQTEVGKGKKLLQKRKQNFLCLQLNCQKSIRKQGLWLFVQWIYTIFIFL